MTFQIVTKSFRIFSKIASMIDSVDSTPLKGVLTSFIVEREYYVNRSQVSYYSRNFII